MLAVSGLPVLESVARDLLTPWASGLEETGPVDETLDCGFAVSASWVADMFSLRVGGWVEKAAVFKCQGGGLVWFGEMLAK